MGEELQFCPNCKKTVSRTNFTVHNVHCQRNIIACSLCQQPVPKSQYQQHVETAHSSISCQRCGTQVEAVQLYYHQTEVCLKRLIACKYCELEVIAGELEDHLEYCGARTDRCKGCTKYVQFKHLQFHYEHDHRYLNPDEKEKAEANGSEGADGEECPVCLGPVTLPLALECGHVFCMVCVKGIANTTKNCAICRRDIPRDMLMDIRFCREEDIIKNYVNNPKYKKMARSKSVPSRRVGTTTQEYDDMVSALLSSRTSSSNYRYQRPNNGHTPPSYTPYGYGSTYTSGAPPNSSHSNSNNVSLTQSTSSFNDDDCCCSNSKVVKIASSNNGQDGNVVTSIQPDLSTSKSVSKHSNQPTSVVPISRANTTTTTTIPVRNIAIAINRVPHTSSTTQPKAPTENKMKSKVESNSDTSDIAPDTSLMPPAGVRRRPTSLALQPNENNFSSGSEAQPRHLSQEEYDRWLAFQLAKTEDEVSTSEFNKNHRSPFRRSRSMPERKEANESNSVSPEDRSEEISRNEIQSGLPPTSPRCCNSAIPVSPGASSSILSQRVLSLSKSSSDSNTNGSSPSLNTISAISTGARPKSSTGLKKRVSFKEDVPPALRQAPVMLPCEFCEEMFPERDLMRHQTSCDQNETKNPREYLLARRSSVTSPITSPTTPQSPTSILSSTSGFVSPLKPPAFSSAISNSAENFIRTNTPVKSLRTPPHSPSLRSRQPPPPQLSPLHSPSISSSPQITLGLSEEYYSPFNSRHTSVSPGPGPSVSSSSDISSGISSINSSSVSTTPSTSSSASPVPANIRPDTPTDIEVDFEEEDSNYTRPRKGRLLSSAIISWRSISGCKPKDRPKYARSNTAPLEITADDELSKTGVTTSHSASTLPSTNQQEDSDEESTLEENSQEPCPIFIKNKNKYPAPPPPNLSVIDTKNVQNDVGIAKSCSNFNNEKMPNSNKKTKNDVPSGHVGRSQSEIPRPNVFKFDSFPVMDGNTQITKTDEVSCEFCKKVFSPEKFRNHQALCETNKAEAPSTNHSSSESNQDNNNKLQRTNIPSRHNKGPAPQPPSEAEFNKRKPVERSHSVRENTSEYRRSREFESSGRRLERACSIKETSRFTRTVCESPPRSWLSREKFYGSSLDCSAAYSGSASLTSSTTSINSYSGGHGWLSHVSMIRDEARSRRAATSLGGTSSPLSSFFGPSRYSERSSSRLRPSSLYSSRNAFNALAEAFSTAREKGRYLR